MALFAGQRLRRYLIGSQGILEVLTTWWPMVLHHISSRVFLVSVVRNFSTWLVSAVAVLHLPMAADLSSCCFLWSPAVPCCKCTAAR